MAEIASSTPKSIEEARAAGTKRYFTGIACRKGHVAERYTSGASCVECSRQARLRLQIEQPERLRAYRAKWIAENPEKHREVTRKHHEENPERRRAFRAKWKKDNPEKLRASARKRYAGDPERFAKQRRDWRKSKPQAAQAIAKRSATKRYRQPKNRLDAAIRASIHRGLKVGAKGGRRSFDLLGYTREMLCQHLELKFQTGMSWENYGEWHVDHIRPLASFTYECPEDGQFLDAWRLENLQPLWRVENQRKGDRVKF